MLAAAVEAGLLVTAGVEAGAGLLVARRDGGQLVAGRDGVLLVAGRDGGVLVQEGHENCRRAE